MIKTDGLVAFASLKKELYYDERQFLHKSMTICSTTSLSARQQNL